MGSCYDSLDKVIVYEWLGIEKFLQNILLQNIQNIYMNIYNVSVEGLCGCVFSCFGVMGASLMAFTD